MKKLMQKTLQQYRSIGKSKNNLYIISFQYRVKVDGKWRVQYFSRAASEIRSDAEMLMYLEDSMGDMYEVLQDYLSRGMRGMTLTGLKIQGYN